MSADQGESCVLFFLPLIPFFIWLTITNKRITDLHLEVHDVQTVSVKKAYYIYERLLSVTYVLYIVPSLYFCPKSALGCYIYIQSWKNHLLFTAFICFGGNFSGLSNRSTWSLIFPTLFVSNCCHKLCDVEWALRPERWRRSRRRCKPWRWRRTTWWTAVTTVSRSAGTIFWFCWIQYST